MISNESSNESFTKRVLIICAVVTLIILLVLATIYVIDVILLLFGAILLAIFCTVWQIYQGVICSYQKAIRYY
jgi:hypothetical protein